MTTTIIILKALQAETEISETELESIIAKTNQARANAVAIPDWATWTEAEALAWHDEHIASPLPFSNLAEANAWAADLENENRAVVRMVLALRDGVFPNLPE